MPKSDDLKDRLDELFSSPQQEMRAGESAVSGETSLAATSQTSAALFETAFEDIAVGMVVTGPDTRFLRVNEAFARMLGYERQELEGSSFQAVTYEEDTSIGAETVKALVGGELRSAQIQKRYVHKDGHLVWVQLYITLLRDAEGKPLHFIALAENISDQKRTAALLVKHVRELDCLSDIGHKIDENPALPDFLQWVTERIKEAFNYPDVCVVAIEYGEQIYGTPEAVDRPTKIVGGLRISGELAGWLHVAYTEPREFIDAESALLGGIVSRVSSYIESQKLSERTKETLNELLTFRQGLEASTDAVFITDIDGKILYVNPAFEKIYGFSRDETIGKNPRIIKSGVIPPEAYKQFWESLLNKQVVSGEIVNKTKEGVLIEIEGSNSPILDENGNIVGFLAVHRDITERKVAEKTLHRRAAELATVAEVSTAAATILRPEELLQSVVELTKQGFGLYHAHIYLLNETKDTLILASGVGEAGKKMVAQGWHIPVDSERSLVARAARERIGVTINDVRAEPDFLPNELLPDTAAEIAVPLVVGGDLLGVLDVQSDQVGIFTEQDVTIYTTLAYQISVALQNARQYERTQQALTAAETLYAGSAWIASSNNMEKILQALIGATSLKKLDRVNIFLFDHPWHVEVPKAVTVEANWEKRGRVSRISVGTVYSLNNLPVLPLLNREQPTIVMDAQADVRLGKELRAALDERGVRGLAIFPLKASGEWIGAVVGEAEQTVNLQVEEVRRINSLMDQAATVTQNLRLIKQTRQAQERAQTILDAVTTPMLISKVADGQIVYANDLLAELVRVPMESLIGKPTPDFYVDLDDRQRVVGQIREKGAVSNYELRLKRSDGEEFWSLLSARLLEYEGEPAIITSLLDVTDRVQAEEELRTTAEDLDRVFSSSLDMIGTANFEGNLISLNPAWEQILGYTREELMEQSFIDLVHPEDVERTTATMASLAEGASVLAFESRNRCKDGSYKWLSTRVTSDLEHGVFHFIARDVTERKQAEEVLAKRLKELQVTNQVAEYIRTGGELEVTLEMIIKAVIEAFGADNAVLSNFDYETQTWRGLVGAGEGMTTEIAKTFTDPGPAYPHGMEAVLTGQVVAVDDAKLYPEFPLEYIEIIGIKSVLTMPVFSGGVVSGVIFFNWNTRQHAFSEEEIALARGLSDQISIGIESQRLFEQARIRAQRLATVAEVSTAAATIFNPQTLLQSVVDLTNESFGLYHTHIYLLDETGEILALAAGAFEVGRMMVAEGWEIPLESERSLVARAVRERQGVIVNDVRADPDFLPNDLLPDTASEMAVPLIAGDQVLGVLDVQSDKVNYFSQEDVDIQTTLASQVSVALQNARQYEQTQLASLQLSVRVKELNCLNDIGHKMDERPTVAEFLEWVAERIPPAMQYPEICVAAIEYRDRVYGHAEAVKLPFKTVAGLRIAGELVGWLHIAYVEERDFLDEESALIGGIASRVSSYVESQILLEQIQAALAQTDALYGISAGLNEASDENELLQVLSKPAIEAGAFRANLIYFDLDESGAPEWAEAVAAWPPEATRSVPVGSRYYLPQMPFAQLWIANPDEPLLVSDITTDERVDANSRAAMARGGGRGMAVVPLTRAGLQVGLIAFNWDKPHEFTQQEADTYRALIDLGSPAVDNRRLINAIQARVRREQALREITTNVRSSIDTDAILRTAVRELGDALGRRAFVRLGSAEQLAKGTGKQVSDNGGFDGHEEGQGV